MAGRTAILGMILVVAACGGKDDDDNAAATTDTTATMAATTDNTTPPPPPAASLPAGVTAEMVTAGEQGFKAGPCMACHGPDAKGTAMAPDLTDATWLNIDGSYDAIKGVIKTGVAKPKDPTHAAPMPPMGGAQLTDQQIGEIGAYVYSLSHKG